MAGWPLLSPRSAAVGGGEGIATMTQLKISTRLVLLTGFVLLLMLGVGLRALNGLSQSNQALKSVYVDRVEPLRQLKGISDLLTNNVNSPANKVRDGLMKPEEAVPLAVQAREGIQKYWTDYQNAPHLTAEEQAMAGRFPALYAKAQEVMAKAEASYRAGDSVTATLLAGTDMYPALEPVQKLLGELSDYQNRQARADYEASEARYASIRLEVVGTMLAGAVLAGLFSWVLIRRVVSSLQESVRIAGAVAEGQLQVVIAPSGRDEITQLMQALATMRDQLQDVVARVRGGAEGVATASAEIAQGNNDLSARTEQQASALQQTAASMEQLSSTVRQNADNARQANQLAMSASTVAIQGGDVVGRVVETMKGINDSSRKISDIISVIDGIAFQTNILALNAAVEAARAGEQGRGFAVVASEVRSLAQRSAEAAKEIKLLISDSVGRVEQGTQLVDQAGSTMSEVVTSIRRVTDIMGEISAASTEQSQGVAQVGEAVTQMDQATQQNAALVEESAAAAGSLQTQAEQLVQAVAVFKLGAGAAPLAFSVPRAAPVARPAPGLQKPIAPVLKTNPPKPAAPLGVATKAAGHAGGSSVERATAAAARTKPAAIAHRAPKALVAAGDDDDWTSF
jgi:methyl-accepting chemotaxis protein